MNIIELNDKVLNEIAKASEAASYLWSREWAERNGGNISLNLTDIIGELPTSFDGFRFIECDNFPQAAAGLVFFVTGTGERLRELTRPDEAGCIVRFNEECTGFHTLWGGKQLPDYRPTSEFISHVKIHLDKLEYQPEHRAVVHTHPLELICLTHHPDFEENEELFNNTIWSMLPEVRAFIPKGVGITTYTLPGSEELADKTVNALKTRDVALWNKHGAVSTGEDALVAFDYIDVANKGAKLYLKCLASNFKPAGLTPAEMQELVEVFGL